MDDTTDAGLFNLSPKVVRPFLAGLIAFAVSWVVSGAFDGVTLALLLASLGYGVIGVAAPPVAGSKVKQAELQRVHAPRR